MAGWQARGLQSRQEVPAQTYEAVWLALQTFLKRCGPPHATPSSLLLAVNFPLKWPGVTFAASWRYNWGFDNKRGFQEVTQFLFPP